MKRKWIQACAKVLSAMLIIGGVGDTKYNVYANEVVSADNVVVFNFDTDGDGTTDWVETVNVEDKVLHIPDAAVNDGTYSWYTDKQCTKLFAEDEIEWVKGKVYNLYPGVFVATEQVQESYGVLEHEVITYDDIGVEPYTDEAPVAFNVTFLNEDGTEYKVYHNASDIQLVTNPAAGVYTQDNDRFYDFYAWKNVKSGRLYPDAIVISNELLDVTGRVDEEFIAVFYTQLVSFDLDGGKAPVTSILSKFGNRLSDIEGIPTKQGYIFNGYKDERTGELWYDAGDKYKTHSKKKNKFIYCAKNSTFLEPVTLKAQWVNPCKEFAIKQSDITLQWDYDVNGTELEAAFVLDEGHSDCRNSVVWEYKLKSDEEWTGFTTPKADDFKVQYPVGLSVGSYDLRCKIVITSNINAQENTYYTEPITFTVERRGNSQADIEIFGEVNMTYDGNPHEYHLEVKNAKDARYDVYYTVTKQAGESFSEIAAESTERPVLTDAGTYVIMYRIESDVFDEITGQFEVAITKPTPTITLEGKTVGVSGSTQGLSGAVVYGVNDEVINVPVKYTYYKTDALVMKTDAEDGAETEGGEPSLPGTYYVVASFAGNENYNSARSSTTVLNILDVPISFTSKGYTGIYDGESHTITIESPQLYRMKIYYTTKDVILDESNYKNIATTVLPRFTDVGEYFVNYFVVAAMNETTTEYYTGSEQVIIKKAQYSVGGSLKENRDHTIQLPTTQENLVWEYKPNGSEYKEYKNDILMPGTYSFRIKGDKNHIESSAVTITIEIYEFQEREEFAELERKLDALVSGYNCIIGYDFNAFEYKLDGTLAWNSPSGEGNIISNLKAGRYEIRVKGNDTYKPSRAVTLHVEDLEGYTAPIVDKEHLIISVDDNYSWEYRLKGTENWEDYKEHTLMPGVYEFRVKASIGSTPSKITEIILPKFENSGDELKLDELKGGKNIIENVLEKGLEFKKSTDEVWQPITSKHVCWYVDTRERPVEAETELESKKKKKPVMEEYTVNMLIKLEAGDYEIRYAGDDLHEPSAKVIVTVTSVEAPNPKKVKGGKGVITGVTDLMEYRRYEKKIDAETNRPIIVSTAWKPLQKDIEKRKGTTKKITGLKEGTYQVRFAESKYELPSSVTTVKVTTAATTKPADKEEKPEEKETEESKDKDKNKDKPVSSGNPGSIGSQNTVNTQATCAHSYVLVSSVTPTFTSKGTAVYKCFKCNYENTIYFDPVALPAGMTLEQALKAQEALTNPTPDKESESEKQEVIEPEQETKYPIVIRDPGVVIGEDKDSGNNSESNGEESGEGEGSDIELNFDVDNDADGFADALTADWNNNGIPDILEQDGDDRFVSANNVTATTPQPKTDEELQALAEEWRGNSYDDLNTARAQGYLLLTDEDFEKLVEIIESENSQNVENTDEPMTDTDAPEGNRHKKFPIIPILCVLAAVILAVAAILIFGSKKKDSKEGTKNSGRRSMPAGRNCNIITSSGIELSEFSFWIDGFDDSNVIRRKSGIQFKGLDETQSYILHMDRGNETIIVLQLDMDAQNPSAVTVEDSGEYAISATPGRTGLNIVVDRK